MLTIVNACRYKLVCAYASVIFFPLFVHANTPALDSTFGNKGVVTTAFKDMHAGTINSEVPTFSVLVQPDNKIVVAGDVYTIQDNAGDQILTNKCIAIVRYNQDGSLDATFGEQGRVVLPDLACTSIALQEDDKLVVAAQGFHKGNNLCDAVVLRLHSNGSLDAAFGKDGLVVENNGPIEFSNLFKIAIQEDGCIVGLGNYIQADPANPSIAIRCQLYMTRYSKDGIPDPSFGDRGKLKACAPVNIAQKLRIADRLLDGYWGGVIPRDGTIVGIGSVGDFGSYLQQDNVKEVDQTLLSDSEDSIIARHLPDGSADDSFGLNGNGFTLTSAGKGCNYFVDVAEDADHKLIALGRAKNSITQKAEVMLVRYLPDGTLDTTFGENGLVLSAIGSTHALAHKLCVQADGKILVTGKVQWGDRTQFTIVRYANDGKLDATFGESGIVTLPVSGAHINEQSLAVALQAHDKLIVAGTSRNSNYSNFAIARLNL